MFKIKTKMNQMAHRAPERTGAYDGGLAAQTHGLMAGTRVASNLGWRAIEAIAVGDSVLTFDHGMQIVTEVRRSIFWTDAPDTQPALWPVIVPKGALGNSAELTLLADQGVLIECDAAADMYGDPFAMIAAYALDGVRGIHRAAPAQQIELIAISFADEQVVYAEGGALIHCPCTTMSLDTFIATDAGVYDMLATREAAFLADCMVAEDRMLATGGWAEGQTARC